MLLNRTVRFLLFFCILLSITQGDLLPPVHERHHCATFTRLAHQVDPHSLPRVHPKQPPPEPTQSRRPRTPKHIFRPLPFPRVPAVPAEPGRPGPNPPGSDVLRRHTADGGEDGAWAFNETTLGQSELMIVCTWHANDGRLFLHER